MVGETSPLRSLTPVLSAKALPSCHQAVGFSPDIRQLFGMGCFRPPLYFLCLRRLPGELFVRFLNPSRCGVKNRAHRRRRGLHPYK